jgi:hypothetical protein
MMNSYIGTKLIKAKKMTNHDFAKEKYGSEKLDNPLMDGYKVQYSDDYTSWSPKEIFELYYKRLNIFDTDYLTELENEFITKNHTYILHDSKGFNAPHNYIIKNSENDNLLAGIHFQAGPLKESGLNGIFMEDLIAICINRLKHFQNSEFKCKENDEAIKKLEESLMCLRKRTDNRKERNVLGTHEI